MNDPVNRISEPILPEHQLVRDVGSLPQLSSGLRERVVINVHKQVRYGRIVDRLRIVTSVLAVCLLAGLVWQFRWTGRDNVTQQQPDTAAPSTGSPMPSSSDYAGSPATKPPTAEKLPQGGPSSVPEMRELQQLNKLIEDIQGRNNVLCGLVEIW